MNRLDQDTRAKIFHLLCEGTSQRTLERVYGVSNKTVAKLFEEAGDMALQYMETLKDLEIKNIQADEQHSYFAAREFNVDQMLVANDEAGTTWAWLAICADSKLVFAHYVGDRTGEDARAFVDKVFSKLRRAPDGSFTVRPQINNDGLPSYRDAIEQAVGAYTDHGVLQKRYDKSGKGKRFVGADRIARRGHPRVQDIHTSYIERQNLNLRMQNRRLIRRTNGFSKTRLNHERHIALWAIYHNTVWVPFPNRVEVIEDGIPKWIWVPRENASVAAGLIPRPLKVEDLVTFTDRWTEVVKPRRPRRDRKPRLDHLPPSDQTVAPFWVYQPFRASQACKVHAATFCNCRGGLGRNVKASGKDGKWMGFPTREAADAAADLLKPGRVETCRMCLGERRKMAGINT